MREKAFSFMCFNKQRHRLHFVHIYIATYYTPNVSIPQTVF